MVPFQYFADKSLGRWVNEQRCQNSRNLLRKPRKDLLVSVGFVWKVASRKGKLILENDADAHARWCYRFRELVEFQKANNGSFDIPNAHVKDSLGHWAAEQKKLMIAGKLDEIKAQRLATIGFCDAGEETLWEKNYQKLRKAGFNSIFSLQDPGLCHWVMCQRYLHKKGKLSNERKMKFFEVPGFMWDSSPLNMPEPEPKHVLKERERSNNNNSSQRKKPAQKQRPTKSSTTKTTKKMNNSADDSANTETESEEEACVGLLAMASGWKNSK